MQMSDSLAAGASADHVVELSAGLEASQQLSGA